MPLRAVNDRGNSTLKEKELRLSLVYYGGVSLAIYMHGVAEEILKLTRASKVFHQRKNGTDDADSYDSRMPNPPYETDTERLYFELFSALSRKINLRVVVDTISGSSAGGINGIFLARALAHDLSLTPQRKMWIELADVLQLMDEETVASRWSKFYLYPVLLILGWRRLRRYFPSEEMRKKVSIFLRSRWLEPPFSGKTMLGWMLDAAQAQGDSENPQCDGKGSSSLLPPGHRLDLIVSLTNFFGKQQKISLNDPPEILEREHKTILRFKYSCLLNGKINSDFNNDSIPGLAFAARATSSFPGAFPPARLGELTKMLDQRGETWPARAAFMAQNAAQFRDHGAEAEKINFIDGSVVNNKPFAEVIAALSDHPAHREVERRIIYIDPSPDHVTAKDNAIAPGWFQTMFDSAVKIPGNEPIRDELQQLNAHNRRARRLQSVMRSLEVDIEPVFENLVTLETVADISTPLLVSWREKVNATSAEKADYAYSGYLSLKLYYLLDSVTNHLSPDANQNEGRSDPDIRAAILSWAAENNIWVANKQGTAKLDMFVIVKTLRGLDVDFRIRRLRFIIKYVNECYQEFDNRDDDLGDLERLNALKTLSYHYINDFKSCWTEPSPVAEDMKVASVEDVNGAVQALKSKWKLEDRDFEFDDAFCNLLKDIKDKNLTLEIIRGYLGFPFYDVLTLPLLQSTDLTEIDTILVNRISPDDRCSIPWPEGEDILQGTNLGNFGAFFERGARENDHIWGRLHASERLVDFVISSAGAGNLPEDFNLTDFKKQLFQSILKSEGAHITEGREEFDRICERVDAIR